MNAQPISDQAWAGIRAEFTLPTLARVHRRLSELIEDPDPVMRQLDHAVTRLFQRAMELQIPHNYFTLWMITPSRELAGTRPVHLNTDPVPLLRALESFGWREH